MKEKIVLVGNRETSKNVLKYLLTDIQQVIINDKPDKMVKTYNKELSRLTVVNTDNYNVFYTYHDYKHLFISLEYLFTIRECITSLSDDNKTLIITILESEKIK